MHYFFVQYKQFQDKAGKYNHKHWLKIWLKKWNGLFANTTPDGEFDKIVASVMLTGFDVAIVDSKSYGA